MVESSANQDKPRLQRLRLIEQEMAEKFRADRTFETSAPEDYSQLSHEEKNDTKFFATFPFPYMNGYLHLGKKKKFLDF